MGERLASGHFEFDKKQREVFRSVGSHALELSALRYGTGYPDFIPGAEANLSLNNSRHNFMAGENAALLMSALGYAEDEQELARISGNVHDVVQLKGRDIDEEESAEWFAEQLARTELFPAAVIELGSRAILGTKVFLDANGNVTGQYARQMEFKSEIEEKLVKSVASADHGEIWTPIGPYLGHLFVLKQARGLTPYDEPNMTDFAARQAEEVAFVENHRYLLPEADKVFATHRREVVDYHRFLAKLAEQGDVERWQQVEAMDLAFRANPMIGQEELLQIAAKA